MSGPNFDDVAGLFDCAQAVYRAADGTLLCVTRRYAAWQVEPCDWVEDDAEGAGMWVSGLHTFHTTTRETVFYLRSLDATRLRHAFDY